jgi:hypothetical protein
VVEIPPSSLGCFSFARKPLSHALRSVQQQAQPSLQEAMEGRNQQMGGVVRVDYFLLDRETRQLYIC